MLPFILCGVFLLLTLPLLVHPQAVISIPSPWSYDDSSPRGPSSWSTLDPNFVECSTGRAQSPIDLPPIPSVSHSPSPLSIHWDDLHSAVSSSSSSQNSSSSLHDVVNTGHSIQVRFDDTQSHVTWQGVQYKLAQFHFHAPSEHSVGGVRQDMELHLVHLSEAGQALVVGVLIGADPHEEEEEAERKKAGVDAGNSASDFLRALTWTHLPSSPSSARTSSQPLLYLLAQRLSSSSSASSPSFWSYPGSLTTPPCSEGVKWFVHTQPLHISTAELSAYTRLFKQTARPVQPLHERSVLLVTTPASHPMTILLVALVLLLFLGVVTTGWGCVRWCHKDTLEEGMAASVLENVSRDKESDKAWRREQDSGQPAAARGVAFRGGRRTTAGPVVSTQAYREEVTPLLPSSLYPQSSFSSTSPIGAVVSEARSSNSPGTVMLRRFPNGRGGSSGSLSDTWKAGEEKRGDLDLQSSPKDAHGRMRTNG